MSSSSVAAEARFYQFSQTTEGRRDFVGLACEPYSSCASCYQEDGRRDNGQDGVLKQEREIEVSQRTRISRAEHGIGTVRQ